MAARRNRTIARLAPAVAPALVTGACGEDDDDGAGRAIDDNMDETLLTRTPEGELAPDLPTQVDDTTWEAPGQWAACSST